MKTHFYFCSLLICFTWMLNAQSWHSLGSGLNGSVSEIVIHGDDVYVGGSFLNVAGIPEADYLVRWDGNEWHAVAPGLNHFVRAIAIHDGDIYVVGGFTNAGGNSDADYIARWDGISWNTVGSHLSEEVYEIAIRGSDIYIAGAFNDVDGNPDADFIAKLEGNNWASLHTGAITFESGVAAMAIDVNNVYIGGGFLVGDVDDNVQNIARWDGENWIALGNGFYGDMGVTSIAIDGSDVYVGGDGGSCWGCCGIARWDGDDWYSLGSGLSACIYGEGAEEIAAGNGHVYVSGWFENAGHVPHTEGIAHWDGSAWRAMGEPEINTEIERIGAIAIDGDDVYVGGTFQEIGGVANTFYIARWGEPQDPSGTGKGIAGRSDIQVFPNPIENIIQYSLVDNNEQMHTVSLTNTSGQVLMQKETDEHELNIAHLPAGLYFLKMSCDTMYGVVKIVKQ